MLKQADVKHKMIYNKIIWNIEEYKILFLAGWERKHRIKTAKKAYEFSCFYFYWEIQKKDDQNKASLNKC